VELAQSNELDVSGAVVFMGGLIVCLALVTLILGIFKAVTGRGITRRSQRTNTPSAISQVLSAAGMLILGLQPFLHVARSFRTALLGLSVVLAIVGVALLVLPLRKKDHHM
jgi:hypothetical protein